MKLEEPYEGRPSRTVLWECRGEIPLHDPMCVLNQQTSQFVECFSEDGSQSRER